MKAAILSIAPDVRVVDITHEIAPHDVLEGALALEAAAPGGGGARAGGPAGRCFPPATIHVAVVDPGVGTARRGLAVASGDQVFIGPDNGLFTPFLGASPWRAFELIATEFRRATVSPTFHGRDVFAPAAAHVARGLSPERLGPRVAHPGPLVVPRPSLA